MKLPPIYSRFDETTLRRDVLSEALPLLAGDESWWSTPDALVCLLSLIRGARGCALSVAILLGGSPIRAGCANRGLVASGP